MLRIKMVMVDNGVTIQSLADDTGINRVTVTNIVNGKESPSSDKASAIAVALGWPEGRAMELFDDVSRLLSPPHGSIDADELVCGIVGGGRYFYWNPDEVIPKNIVVTWSDGDDMGYQYRLCECGTQVDVFNFPTDAPSDFDTFKCSSCGHVMVLSVNGAAMYFDDDGNSSVPVYCPNCMGRIDWHADASHFRENSVDGRSSDWAME